MIRSIRVIGLVLILQMISHLAKSQVPEIPVDYSWNSAAEYARDQSKVREVLKWLCKTPLGVEVQKRSEANLFVMEWIAGSPGFTLKLSTVVLPEFPIGQEQLMYSYIHGAALYAMDHPNEQDSVRFAVEGLKVLARLVEQSESLSKERAMRPLLKAFRKNKLKEYALKNWSGTEH
jgi:hypothetical protein